MSEGAIRQVRGPDPRLAQVEHELREVMRRTKFGFFGEHTVTHQHVSKALDLLVQIQADEPDG